MLVKLKKIHFKGSKIQLDHICRTGIYTYVHHQLDYFCGYKHLQFVNIKQKNTLKVLFVENSSNCNIIN